MAYPDFTSGSVMDRAAVLNNDPNKTIYPYVKQVPFLNQALQELQEYFELNNVPVTDTVTSDPITVPANVIFIGFPPDSPISNTPYLPTNLVEPKVLWSRAAGVDPYVPMQRVDFLPRWEEGVEIQYALQYTWQSQEIRFLPCNQINQIKMDYIRFLFEQLDIDDDGSTVLSVINSQSYLQYRTGGLVARFLGENPSRATDLDNDASLAMDRVLGVASKGRQRIQVRHRPFRSGYKRFTYT